ncbi:TetR/AcrR family transcriptional regulator [Kineococcus sp. NUM-3379]
MLATARELFATRGYAAVGLEEVAAAAGVTRGAVYHHYASRLGVFEAVLADVQRTVAAAVEQAAAQESDPWRALEAGCRAFLTASSTAGARRIVLVDAPAVLGWDVWRRHDAENSARLLTGAMRELAAAGRLTVRSPDAAAALLSGALNEAALWTAAAEDPAAALAEAGEVLTRLVTALRA